MAFKRGKGSYSSLKSNKFETFSSTYSFKKKVPDFKVGKDVYVMFLGLDDGFFETPTHRVLTHEVEGQTVSFGMGGRSLYPTTIKCKGVDEEGNRIPCLCCQLASAEKTREEDLNKRVIGGQSSKINIPILVLGNSLTKEIDSYPVSKVALVEEMKKQGGLNFSYLEFARSTFKKDVIDKLGHQLKDDSAIDFELDENSDEYFEQVLNHLSDCVVRIKGYKKDGFAAAMKEYTFFPFATAKDSIASQSSEMDKKLILEYKKSPKVMEQVNEFLALFGVEVDKLFIDWNEKDLQEYYNSATGTTIQPPKEEPKKVEKVEIVEAGSEEDPFKPTGNVSPSVSDDELTELLSDPFAATTDLSNEEEPVIEEDFELDNEEDFFS